MRGRIAVNSSKTRVLRYLDHSSWLLSFRRQSLKIWRYRQRTSTWILRQRRDLVNVVVEEGKLILHMLLGA